VRRKRRRSHRIQPRRRRVFCASFAPIKKTDSYCSGTRCAAANSYISQLGIEASIRCDVLSQSWLLHLLRLLRLHPVVNLLPMYGYMR
jgi:hypothetical protein